MKPTHYDFISIGGGSAGYAGARTARQYVPRVAVVDGAKPLGGLCILRGCMPSKTLLYSAEVLHHAKQARALGLRIPEAAVDMPALQARKKRVIGEFQQFREEQLTSDRFTLYRSPARFTGANELTLQDGTRLTADRFLIATGSSVNVPPVEGLAQTPFLTSDDVLSLERVPESVVVLGGGVVACELGQFLARAGAKVTLIQRGPHILHQLSPEAALVVAEALREEGIDVLTGTHLRQVRKTATGVAVVFEHEGRQLVREAEALFNAMGRVPETAGLNLAAAGVETRGPGQIVTRAFQQTSNPAIYAAGDCCGPHEIVHVAIMQAETAARHACGKASEPVPYDTLTSVVFTDPQVGIVGLSEAELKRRGVAYHAAKHPFNDHGKSILMEAPHGYVKVLARQADGRILGAECVGRDASELIHTLAVAVSLGATVFDLLKVHWYHPTLAEIWTYPLEEIADAVRPPVK